MGEKNKSIAVIYKSKYGSTKKYAGWIALKLDADLYEISDIRGKDLKEYDTIIYGGPLHAGKIKGIDLINKNYDSIKDKEIVIFPVGVSLESENTKDIILENNFSEDMKNNIEIIYLKGAFNYNELSLGDKVIMSMFKAMAKSKSNEDENMKAMLKMIDTPVDFCNKKSVEKIVSYVGKNA